MNKPLVLFLDSVHPILQEELEKMGFLCHFHFTTSLEDLLPLLPLYSGLVIRSRLQVDANFLKHATKLKFICRSGSGMENIDLAFAKSRNIECINSPEGNQIAVAEHALGMLLSLLNQLKDADLSVRKGLWEREKYRGLELSGKTIGILGYGHTGSSFAKLLSGFNVKILAYDKYKNNFSNSYLKEVDLPTIFKETDVLSLHLPLTAETQQLVNANFIAQFKKPFYLLNTARGNQVNTIDLLEALRTEKILGACLDVLEYEEKSFDLKSNIPEELLQSPKVLLSPHVAGWTKESYYKLSKVLADKVSNFLKYK